MPRARRDMTGFLKRLPRPRPKRLPQHPTVAAALDSGAVVTSDFSVEQFEAFVRQRTRQRRWIMLRFSLVMALCLGAAWWAVAEYVLTQGVK